MKLLPKLQLIGLMSLISLIRPIPVVLAVENPQSSGDMTVSATVYGTGYPVSIPHLHSPENGSVTNNRYQQFSWQRSSGSLMHYVFYFDGIEIVTGITHEPSQDKVEWSAQVDSGYVYFTYKTPLPEGIHYWQLKAQGAVDYAYSEIWSLTIDSIPPVIILQAVDINKMYWSTNAPSGIPPESERNLIVTTQDPLLSGKVEARSNIKYSLVCPALRSLGEVGPSSNCENQSQTDVSMTGFWEHRFSDLLANVRYTVYISATDTAGNSNTFPSFTIIYKPKPEPSETPTIIPLPSEVIVSPTATVSATITLSPTPTEIEMPILPEPNDLTGFYRAPPPAPRSPEPSRTDEGPSVALAKEGTPIPPTSYSVLYLFLIFGLLLHLLMTFFGTKVRLRHLPGFIFDLTLPFIGQKPYATEPNFTTVVIYDPDKLEGEFSSWISNIRGKLQLELPPSKKVFIKLERPGYEETKTLVENTGEIELTPLKLKPQDSIGSLERSRMISLTLRLIPLLAADITSLIVLIKMPSLPIVIYFIYASLLSYSEYIYPRTKP